MNRFFCLLSGLVWVVLSVPVGAQPAQTEAEARALNLVKSLPADLLQMINRSPGSFEVRVKIAPSLRPGQTLMYHAWESYQFKGKGDMNSVSPSPLNPVELAGGHPHLTAGVLQGQNSVFDRETRIEIERLSA